MATTTYGQKGGEGPTRGKKATAYLVTLPDGATAKKRVFDTPANPTGFAYQHGDRWYVATVADEADDRFAHYTKCPAVRIAQ